jgi:ribose-phosphate pyrophosphokinase
MEFSNFADGEIKLNISASIRGNDVFIIQSTQPPAENLVELLLMIDAAKRASAGRVTAVVPYFGYARQDRKDAPHVPISSKLMANLLTTAGADRILTIDLLSDKLFIHQLKKDEELWESLQQKNFVVVSPDTGGVKRSELFLSSLVQEKGWDREKNFSYTSFFRDHTAIFYKIRYGKDKAIVSDKPLGHVEGKLAIIRDDIVDTAGTIKEVIEKLVAINNNDFDRKVICCITHGILVDKSASGNLNTENVKRAIRKIYVTDTVPLSEHNRIALKETLEVVSVATLFANAILRIHLNESLSSLF